MRRRIAIAIVGLLVASSSAQAGDLFDSFKRICIDTKASLNTTLAAADAAGWVQTAQPRIVTNMPADFLMMAAHANVKMGFRSSKDHKYVLIVAEGQSEFSPKFIENTCLYLAPKGAISANFVKQAAALAVVPRTQPSLAETSSELFEFHWREENGRHIRVDPFNQSKLQAVAEHIDNLVITRTESPIAFFSVASKRN